MGFFLYVYLIELWVVLYTWYN